MKKRLWLFLGSLTLFISLHSSALAKYYDLREPIVLERVKKEALSGNTYFQAVLGQAMLTGNGIEQNVPEAKTWLHKAARHKSDFARSVLCVAYHSEEYVKRPVYSIIDSTCAFSLKALEKQAEMHNDAHMQYNLGHIYAFYLESPDKAIKWLLKAAEQSHLEAQFIAGLVFSAFIESDESKPKAFEWYLKAAEQGHVKSQQDLGSMYCLGNGIKKNALEALKWYEKAVSKNAPFAEYSLGDVYYNGICVEQDYVEAVQWFKKAAEHGYPYAQYKLGYMYYEGKGVKKDHAEAVQWFKKAAVLGHLGANQMLLKLAKPKR